MPWRRIEILARRIPRAVAARVHAAPAVVSIAAKAAVSALRRRADRPDLVLHAGQHKTGSTTIQAVIRHLRAELADEGIHVLWSGQGSDGAHHSLIYSLTGQPSRWVSMHLLRAEMAQAFPRRVLISSEVATEVIVRGGGHGLIDSLRAAGAGRVHLLLYLRCPFALSNAAFSEQTSSLRGGGMQFSDYLRARDQRPSHRYDRFLELAQREDVTLSVRPYAARVRQSIIGDFADALGVTLVPGDEPRLNTSYGPVALEAMRILANETDPLDPEVHWRLQERLPAIARTLGEHPFWGMDEDHRRLLPEADRQTEAFAKTLWGCGWREAIGEESRPLNVFDPGDVVQREMLADTLARMRAEKAKVFAEPARW